MAVITALMEYGVIMKRHCDTCETERTRKSYLACKTCSGWPDYSEWVKAKKDLSQRLKLLKEEFENEQKQLEDFTGTQEEEDTKIWYLRGIQKALNIMIDE